MFLYISSYGLVRQSRIVGILKMKKLRYKKVTKWPKDLIFFKLNGTQLLTKSPLL